MENKPEKKAKEKLEGETEREKSPEKFIFQKVKFFDWKRLFSFVSIKAQHFTLAFFSIIFILSIYVWWNCFFRPTSSSSTKAILSEGLDSFEKTKSNIDETLEFLKEKESRFNNIPSFDDQRELFLDFERERIQEEEEAAKRVEQETGNKTEGLIN